MKTDVRPLNHLLGKWLSECALREASDAELLAAFVQERDEAAFAVLMDRYGTMVLHAGRRVLGDVHAAEDIVQATFLVLARKAPTLRQRQSLNGWLFCVARRLAARQLVRANRRKTREQRAALLEEVRPHPQAGLAWTEIQRVLDEVLESLPEKLRAPVLLHYLEGRTQDVAARHLGWPLRTFAWRLAQGRKVIAAKLSRRGITDSALATLAAIGLLGIRNRVSAAMVEATVAAAVQVRDGASLPTCAGVSTVAGQLGQGLLRSMFWSRVRWISLAVVLALGAVATAWLRAGTPAGPARVGEPVPVAASNPEPFVEGAIQGVVVDPTGRPVPKALVALFVNPSAEAACDVVKADVKTDERGCFQIHFKECGIEIKDDGAVKLLAVADGLAPFTSVVSHAQAEAAWRIRLPQPRKLLVYMAPPKPDVLKTLPYTNPPDSPRSIAVAQIGAVRFGAESFPKGFLLPRSMACLQQTRTNADGFAILDGLSPESAVYFISSGFGTPLYRWAASGEYSERDGKEKPVHTPSDADADNARLTAQLKAQAVAYSVSSLNRVGLYGRLEGPVHLCTRHPKETLLTLTHTSIGTGRGKGDEFLHVVIHSLPPGAVINGNLVDGASQPVRGARVAYYAPVADPAMNGYQHEALHRLVSDANGTFSLTVPRQNLGGILWIRCGEERDTPAKNESPPDVDVIGPGKARGPCPAVEIRFERSRPEH